MRVSRESLIAEALRLVGVPFLHQGRSVYGVDCIGAIALAASNAGLDPERATGLKDTRDYGRAATPLLLDMVSRSCVRVRDVEPGLLVLFRFPDEVDPQHFAILTDKGTIVHADARQGRVVEHGYRGLWLRWTHSLWRIPGVAYDVP
jgi:cell wall-associated NlpC family hydrolase